MPRQPTEGRPGQQPRGAVVIGGDKGELIRAIKPGGEVAADVVAPRKVSSVNERTLSTSSSGPALIVMPFNPSSHPVRNLDTEQVETRRQGPQGQIRQGQPGRLPLASGSSRMWHAS